MALIGEMKYLTIGSDTYSINSESEHGQPFIPILIHFSIFCIGIK